METNSPAAIICPDLDKTRQIFHNIHPQSDSCGEFTNNPSEHAAIIIRANTGLGIDIVSLLLSLGLGHVILAVRSAKRNEGKKGNERIMMYQLSGTVPNGHPITTRSLFIVVWNLCGMLLASVHGTPRCPSLAG